MSQSKKFTSYVESEKFISSLPPCASVTRRFVETDCIIVRWAPLRLRLIRSSGAYVYPPKFMPVVREIAHAYMVKDDLGQMIKVNRYTLMAGTMRFELE